MGKVLKIAIIDSNIFFVYGLKCALSDFFNQRGTPFVIVNEHDNTTLVDMVFYSQKNSIRSTYCNKGMLGHECHPLFFTLRNKDNKMMPNKSLCTREVGEIDTHVSIQKLYELLELFVWKIPLLLKDTLPCEYCLSRRLSEKEKMVISYLSSGLSQTETAKNMHLSVKTVNSYKRSIMLKLNIIKKIDFFKWLLQLNLLRM